MHDPTALVIQKRSDPRTRPGHVLAVLQSEALAGLTAVTMAREQSQARAKPRIELQKPTALRNVVEAVRRVNIIEGIGNLLEAR